jgi:hypothetical protein
MARKNLVSASITDEAMTAVKKGLGDIATALPFLIVLSAEERRRTRVMGHKSVEFVNLALNGAESFSEYLLSSFDKAELAKDIAVINKLWKIRVDVASLLEKIDDTIYGASADAIKAADEVYEYLKSASGKNAAVKALVAEMSKRYERPSKKSKDDPNKPADPKQPADPKKPAEPKQPDTPKKPKDNEPDIHLPEG